ncbi:hypothetical protein M153_6170005095, partial [Pseudoloma neurophilia]
CFDSILRRFSGKLILKQIRSSQFQNSHKSICKNDKMSIINNPLSEIERKTQKIIFLTLTF